MSLGNGPLGKWRPPERVRGIEALHLRQIVFFGGSPDARGDGFEIHCPARGRGLNSLSLRQDWIRRTADKALAG